MFVVVYLKKYFQYCLEVLNEPLQGLLKVYGSPAGLFSVMFSLENRVFLQN